MRAVDLLIKAREILSDPKRWTKGRMAHTSAGRGCPALSPEASCWCSFGALIKAAGDGDDAAIGRAHYALGKAAGSHSVIDINDDMGTTHADVMRWFDDAIRLEKAAP